MSDHDAGSDVEAHADDGHGDDHGDHEADHAGHGDEHDDHGHGDESDEGRVTSPMQEFESSQVTTGFVVLVVGLVVVFGIPLLL
jgi:hypothetical protein